MLHFYGRVGKLVRGKVIKKNEVRGGKGVGAGRSGGKRDASFQASCANSGIRSRKRQKENRWRKVLGG